MIHLEYMQNVVAELFFHFPSFFFFFLANHKCSLTTNVNFTPRREQKGY